VIELREVRHRYGARVVLDLPAFALPAGGRVAIVGHNGAGKSTLLRILALLEPPTEGRVLLDGVPVAGPRDSARARRRVTLVEQRPILLRGTVRDNIAYGLAARRAPAHALRRAVAEAAERTGVTPLLDRRRHELSDGEVQRIAVARALAVRPDVLLLDEPASSADRAAARALLDALEAERRERALTVCLASHQLEDAYRWTDDIRALADGRLSPVTPENLFRVTLPDGGAEGVKHVRVGGAELAVLTERAGHAVLAVPPTDILVSTEPVAASARNVLAGHVTRVARPRPQDGGVHVTADVGVELTAVVTEEALRELSLAPGRPVVLTFKASAVRVL
jgi:tungstate transport system ATP-binding protein